MTTTDRSLNELVNKGVIVLRPGTSAPGARTFIVTGLRRSGTSLVASILRHVGIFMGSRINDNVHEDEEIVELLSKRDTNELKRLIRGRNADYGTWGFKVPVLQESLGPGDIAWFGNPHVIAMFRDPVSIAVRNALSDYQEPMRELQVAIDEQSTMATFIGRLTCPTLLLSYEKSLSFPDDFIKAIIQFCGLPGSELLRDRLVQLIDPNHPGYIAQARRRYDGVIDRVMGGYLHGWCRLTSADDPVELELFADDRPIARFHANEFRQDLLDAGFGTGKHGFVIDVGKLGLTPDAVVRIKVAKYGVELENSGRMLGAYIAASPTR
jgi:hypothetical protein